MENLGQFSDLEKGGHRNSSEDGEGRAFVPGERKALEDVLCDCFRYAPSLYYIRFGFVINIWDEGKDFEAWAFNRRVQMENMCL